MRRYLSILTLLVLALSSISAHTYTPTSVLSSGKWVKIRVLESGVYCLTYDEIQAAGLNPANLRIYGYGGAMLQQDFELPKIDDLPPVSFYMHTGADGVFSQGDYVLFYAQGVDSWQYQSGHFVHTRNPYSSYGYYFLTDDAGEQHLIPTAQALTDATYSADTYTAYMVHDLDSVNLVDVSGKAGGGRTFYGESLSSVRPKLTIRFPFHDVVPESSLDICCRVAGTSRTASTFTMKVGSASLSCTTDGISVSDFYTRATRNAKDRLNFPAVGTGEQEFILTFSNATSGSRGYLNYVEMAATCRMVMSGQEMVMVNVDHLYSSSTTRYTLSNASFGLQIWDISSPESVTRIPATISGSTLSYVGDNSRLQTVLAIDPTRSTGWRKPVIIGQVPNQNLHALMNIDLVIICPEQFLSAAKTIADAHEQYDQLTTAIVTDQQVYNEFSSGTPDATAYRWIMKMLYDRAGSNATQRPKSLLLFGDGSYDNRKLMPTSGPNTLLTYQAVNSEVETKAYATDDYFGFLDDDEGTSDKGDRMDIGVGRLPVTRQTEAEAVAGKIATFIRNENPGPWHQQLLFAADDGDGNLHTSITDSAAERTRRRNEAFVVNKIYLDAYTQEASASGESYPLAKNRFMNLLNDGVLFFDYSGHGGYNNISSESILTLRDCKTMTNRNLGFWMLATCGFAHFDAYEQSASEEAVINPDGGAIAVMSSCRTVYASQNKEINRNLCDTLFGHRDDFNYNMSIGEACRIAKNMTGSDENKLPYILLGDPAIRLHYPTSYRVRTEQASDTLNALTLHTFTGWVEQENGDTARDFNGVVSISLMDKLQQITTLDNDQSDEGKKVKYTYNDYPNTLYQGQARVTNGHFSYTFMMPKDIRYNYGKGRITYYAIDSINGEGVGHYESFVVGGSSSVAIIDTVGPDLNIYLNSPSFRSGDKTTSDPHFFADIYDEHGINTVGSGIGHDLLLVIDDDPNAMFVVNDYYHSTGSYQSGQVSYRMSSLAEGQHTLTFRAWDMLNNSSSRSLNFEVVNSLAPTMYSIMMYPNPLRVSETMHFTIDYDQPDELMEIGIYVYSPTGQLVYQSLRKGTEQYSFSVNNAQLTPGVYIYRVSLTTTRSETTARSGRLIVVENK